MSRADLLEASLRNALTVIRALSTPAEIDNRGHKLPTLSMVHEARAFEREVMKALGPDGPLAAGPALAQVEPIGTGNVQDIPSRLREIADQIERGEHGDVVQLAWVMTDGVPRREPAVGLLGPAIAVGPELHLLLTRGALVIAGP